MGPIQPFFLRLLLGTSSFSFRVETTPIRSVVNMLTVTRVALPRGPNDVELGHDQLCVIIVGRVCFASPESHHERQALHNRDAWTLLITHMLPLIAYIPETRKSPCHRHHRHLQSGGASRPCNQRIWECSRRKTTPTFLGHSCEVVASCAAPYLDGWTLISASSLAISFQLV